MPTFERCREGPSPSRRSCAAPGTCSSIGSRCWPNGPNGPNATPTRSSTRAARRRCPRARALPARRWQRDDAQRDLPGHAHAPLAPGGAGSSRLGPLDVGDGDLRDPLLDIACTRDAPRCVPKHDPRRPCWWMSEAIPVASNPRSARVRPSMPLSSNAEASLLESGSAPKVGLRSSR